MEKGKRCCSLDNDTLSIILDNSKEFLKYRDRIYIEDVKCLLEKALEGVTDKKDLSPSEAETIKTIRKIIKGL